MQKKGAMQAVGEFFTKATRGLTAHEVGRIVRPIAQREGRIFAHYRHDEQALSD
jgi:hypothetical protein